MKRSVLEEEITALRKEVELLRRHQATSEAKTEPSSTHHHTATLDENVKKALTKCFMQAKKDYDNLSPATILLLFALGALFGRTLTRRKGVHE